MLGNVILIYLQYFHFALIVRLCRGYCLIWLSKSCLELIVRTLIMHEKVCDYVYVCVCVCVCVLSDHVWILYIISHHSSFYAYKHVAAVWSQMCGMKDKDISLGASPRCVQSQVSHII